MSIVELKFNHREAEILKQGYRIRLKRVRGVSSRKKRIKKKFIKKYLNLLMEDMLLYINKESK